MISAVIFDMDGVIVDNMQFHRKAWHEFTKKQGKNLSDEELKQHIYGRDNRAALTYLLDRELSDEEIAELGEQKEMVYREIYRPYLAPVPNLIDFLERTKSAGIKMAIATSADIGNVDFVLDGLGIRDFFPVIIDASMVSKSKPDPEIYLKTAAALGEKPENCIVVEDSISGVKSGKNAGMRVIGITTTHGREDLSEADWIIDDYKECIVSDLDVDS